LVQTKVFMQLVFADSPLGMLYKVRIMERHVY
jgi:hypothetical protein